MGRRSLELRILKKIPARYYKTDVFDGDPAGLEQAYGDAAGLSDPYHIRARIRSRYCSMDQLKEYLVRNHPELDLSGWSMTGGYNHQDVRVTDMGGAVLVVPLDIYETLKTDHINESVFECQELCWSIDLGYNDEDWLAPVLPCYLDKKVLAELALIRYEWARKSDPEARSERVGMAGYSGSLCPDVIGFLADGLAEAKSKRCAVYACIVE